MCIPVFEIFAGLWRVLKTDTVDCDRAIASGFRGRGCLLDGAVAGDEGEDGVLAGADLDAGCLIEQQDCAMREGNTVGAEAAKKDNNEHETRRREPECETDEARIEKT